MAADLPRELTPLVELMCGHLAAELNAAECPPALRASVIVFARECMRVAVAAHEHPTPVVEVTDTRPSEYARSTLPTEPPGVDYADPPTRRTRSLTVRGGFKAPSG